MIDFFVLIVLILEDTFLMNHKSEKLKGSNNGVFFLFLFFFCGVDLCHFYDTRTFSFVDALIFNIWEVSQIIK